MGQLPIGFGYGLKNCQGDSTWIDGHYARVSTILCENQRVAEDRAVGDGLYYVFDIVGIFVTRLFGHKKNWTSLRDRNTAFIKINYNTVIPISVTIKI